MTLYNGDTFEHDGHTFRFKTERDDFGETPWERDEGCGPVSEWTTRDKAPGEWVLTQDRGSYRYYDAQEAMRRAKADGWGLNPDDLTKLTDRLGRTPTKGEIVAAAVRQEFDRMRRWCRDEWEYVGVIVTHGDYERSLWGIESDCYDYLEEVAHELADEIIHEIETEAREAAHWAAKDLATLS